MENTIMFVETYNNQWVWKRYDSEGNVLFMSNVFETERDARADFEVNGLELLDSNGN